MQNVIIHCHSLAHSHNTYSKTLLTRKHLRPKHLVFKARECHMLWIVWHLHIGKFKLTRYYLSVSNNHQCRDLRCKDEIIITLLTCICCLFPAVILDIVQEASFLIDSLGDARRCSRQGSAEQLRITWVCTSSPVTMLPTALRAADTTLCWLCLQNNIHITWKSIILPAFKWSIQYIFWEYFLCTWAW